MKQNLDEIEQYRFSWGVYQSKKGDRYGLFKIPFENRHLNIMVAPDFLESGVKTPWEHVSISLPNRCPNWKEMSYVKELFWDDEDIVVQFHPKKSEHVNMHDTCLHLWKWNEGEIPCPTSYLVGLTDKQMKEGVYV